MFWEEYQQIMCHALLKLKLKIKTITYSDMAIFDAASSGGHCQNS
jgi:hypothetical protein